MTTRLPDEIPYLYLAQDDLFRLGNAGSSRLDHLRVVDVDVYERNGIQMVSANGKGISVFTEKGIERLRGGWLWKIPHGTNLPVGLGLHNDHGSHFMICPLTDMMLDSYKALLSQLALHCERVRKI